MRMRALTMAVAICAAMATTPAHADELYRFLQLTCAPRVHYFSARIIPIYNLPSNGPYRDKGLDASLKSRHALERESNLFDVINLTRHPSRCNLPYLEPKEGRGNQEEPATSINIVGHYKYHYNKKTGQDDVRDYSVSVIVDGHERALLDLDENAESSSDIASVEVEDDGQAVLLRTCRVQSPPGEPSENEEAPFPGKVDTLNCKATILRPNVAPAH